MLFHSILEEYITIRFKKCRVTWLHEGVYLRSMYVCVRGEVVVQVALVP